MRHLLKLLAVILFAAIALGCTNRNTKTTMSYQDAIYTPTHATRFKIFASGQHSSILQISNPWQGADSITMDLFISRGGETPPEGFNGTVLPATPERVVCMSTSYVAFIDALGKASTIKGVSGVDYVSNSTVQSGYKAGTVHDVGYDANMNYELLASIRPDMVFIYGVAGENTAITSKLNELGIKSFYIGDYLEGDPLGKAEWIVAMGEIFDCRESAEEIFNGIAERYDSLKHSATNYTEHPKVMLNAPYRDTWFVPGDRNYMVRLINDAGGEYVCAGEDSDISRPISGEAAYIYAQSADLWINPNSAVSLNEVKMENPKFSNIPAVKNRQVYNCTKRRTEAGGSDFWESGALRADLVLEDLFAILHPENSITAGGNYFERLE